MSASSIPTSAVLSHWISCTCLNQKFSLQCEDSVWNESISTMWKPIAKRPLNLVKNGSHPLKVSKNGNHGGVVERAVTLCTILSLHNLPRIIVDINLRTCNCQQLMIHLIKPNSVDPGPIVDVVTGLLLILQIAQLHDNVAIGIRRSTL